MKRSFLLLPLIAFGCASMNSSPQEERHKMELTLTKLRSDIEELRHDLNSHQMELHLLEGKITNQENSLAHLKTQALDQQQIRLDQVIADLTKLEKEGMRHNKKLEEVLSDLRQLTLHANETTAALTQYKEKINETERAITTQNQKLEEIAKLKSSLKELAAIGFSSQENTYVVQSGDTLEKIARHFQISTYELKKKNQLANDTIYIGQELAIPSPTR